MRYRDEQDENNAADFEAECAAGQEDYDRALREIDVDAPGLMPLGLYGETFSPDDRARAEGFTFWD